MKINTIIKIEKDRVFNGIFFLKVIYMVPHGTKLYTVMIDKNSLVPGGIRSGWFNADFK